ncbi:MAG TPA: cysteine synthase family protein [Gemmatimonadota bacterium]|nr:cysteine synthase family protein [Gemmatimonadota bacterium]
MPTPHSRPYDNVLETIGWTPLVRLRRLTEGLRTPVYLKLESLNPAGSVKDRIGTAIVDAAERDGTLSPGGTIVEGTAGNTGLALAMVAAVRGYDCVFTVPDKMSDEKIQLLRAYGAEVVVVPTVPPDHPEHYGTVARRIADERAGAVLADESYNPANPAAHETTTGPEIWEQTGGAVTHFIASAGPGGTITGAGRYLKGRNPGVRVIGADPLGSIYAHYKRTGELIEGERYKVEGVGNDKIPGTLDIDVVDEFRTVDDGTAFRMARRITREEGMLAGGSTGLIVSVALEVAAEADDPDACVVALFCDTGERYLSKLYDDAWMEENGFL